VKIVVVGGGPLGLFYASQLRRVGGNVTVMRRSAPHPVEHWRVEARFVGKSFDVELPIVNELPPSVDVVVIAVRGEQLTSELVAQVAAVRPKAIVCFTPALGEQLTPWRAAHPELVTAMPSVAVEITGETSVRRELGYWVAPSTLIERRGPNPALHEFVTLLRRAGVPTRWVEDAASRTVANTIALFPLHVAIYLEPRFRCWAQRPELVAELASAMRRARHLALRVGRVELALRFLAWWLSGATRVHVAVRMQLWFAPRLTGFLEHHFGPKLGAQHAALQRDIEICARRYGLPSPVSEVWAQKLG
jgi:2-dehydropantoate 2-reductase